MKPKLFITLMLAVFATAACTGGSHQSPDVPDLQTETSAEQTKLVRKSLTSEQMNYVNSGNELAFRILDSMNNVEDASFAYSPLSVQYALGLLSNCTAGNTYREIADALDITKGQTDFNEYSRILLEQLASEDSTVDVSLANAMLVSERFTIDPTFSKTAENDYGTLVASGPFVDASKATAQVNTWCNGKTNGYIPEILGSVSPQSAGYLMSSLYFRGGWTVLKAQGHDCSEGVFKAEGSEISLNYMDVDKAIFLAERETYMLAMLELGYDWDYAFYVLLPKEKDGLARMLSSMTADEWQKARLDMSMEAVHFRFPEIKTENEFNMGDILALVGVNKAFSSADSDFTCLDSAEGFRIDRFVHKSRLSIGRTGTEGATPIVIEKDVQTPVPGQEPVAVVSSELTADHPFAFIIAERSLGTILFSGVFKGL